jgi:hypothetical protein
MSEPVAWMLIDTQTNTRIPRSSEPKGLDTSRWTVKPLYDVAPVEPIDIEVDPATLEKLREYFTQPTVNIAMDLFEPEPVAPTEWLESAMEKVMAYAELKSKYDVILARTAHQPTVPTEVTECRDRMNGLRLKIRDHLNKRINGH